MTSYSTLLTVFVFFAGIPSLHAFPNHVDVFKHSLFLQTSSSGSFQRELEPYAFNATVPRSSTLQTQSLVIPDMSEFTSKTIILDQVVEPSSPPILSSFEWERSFNDLDSLESAFASGSYSWDIVKPDFTPTSIHQSIYLPSQQSFPTFVPSIRGGIWNNGVLYVSPTPPFTLLWDAWLDAMPGSKIEFQMGNTLGNLMDANSTSLTWPLYIRENTEYEAYLSFLHVSDSVTNIYEGPAVHNTLTFRSGYANTLRFTISTFPIPEPSTILLLAFAIFMISKRNRIRKCN